MHDARLILGVLAGSLLSACFTPSPIDTTTTSTAGSDDGSSTGGTVDPTTGPILVSGSSLESTDGSGSETGVPMSCSDGALNGDETDLDCGGACPPCESGQACEGPDDCSSGVCTGDTCQAASCGDGVVQGREACDDGEATAECTARCTLASCGDGVVTGAEGCDDEGESAECNVDCTVAACGDGLINASAGEGCDDEGETAECNADCTESSCGDLVHNATAGEDCDEGVGSSLCDADCTSVACGDGFMNMNAGEQCDDGGESVACDTDCTQAFCGDGTVNFSAGEECEGGTPETCTGSCIATGCGPDPVELAMTACFASFPNCEVQQGGVVGYGAGGSAGANCGTPASAWRFYCTESDDGTTNYNCAACSIGEIQGPHDPCNCTAGSAPILGTFCTI